VSLNGQGLRNWFAVRWSAFLLSFFIMALWETAVHVFDVKPERFPGVMQVLRGLWELIRDGRLLDYIVASLFRVTWGYLLAVALAVPLGIFLGTKPFWRMAVNPVIQFMRPISPLAWIPIALLWFGIGDNPAIFLIFLAVFFPMVLFTTSGVAGINPTYLYAASNFGITGHEFYSRIILQAALPEIITGLRITLGTAWLVIVAAEMIAVKNGLGYLIVDARNSLRMDQVLGGMLVIGFIGLLLDNLVRQLERLPSVRWKRLKQ
jgi:NitT/TauT family transport system permease protein